MKALLLTIFAILLLSVHSRMAAPTIALRRHVHENEEASSNEPQPSNIETQDSEVAKHDIQIIAPQDPIQLKEIEFRPVTMQDVEEPIKIREIKFEPKTIQEAEAPANIQAVEEPIKIREINFDPKTIQGIEAPVQDKEIPFLPLTIEASEVETKFEADYADGGNGDGITVRTINAHRDY